MNFYMRRWYRAVPDGLGFTERLAREGDDTTEMGWGIVPDAMGEQLARLRADYPPIPLYITENGMADREGVGADGQSTTIGGSTTCGATSRWPRRRSPRAPTCAGTSCGASWTTSNGGSGTGHGSGSSTSTTRRRRGPRRTARAGTRGDPDERGGPRLRHLRPPDTAAPMLKRSAMLARRALGRTRAASPDARRASQMTARGIGRLAKRAVRRMRVRARAVLAQRAPGSRPPRSPRTTPLYSAGSTSGSSPAANDAISSV